MVNAGKAVHGRPFTAWILILLIFTLGIGAIISGAMLFLAPDGHLMQISTDVLEGSPFFDFLIPGVILFVFLGIYPLLTGIGLLRRSRQVMRTINPFNNHHWSWTASLVAGIILLIWIITETLLLGYVFFLQPVMAAWGILIILLTLLPSVSRYFRLLS